uniref:Reverse transcriptase domain-containing protein n=1 Tax=Tanacetum cinerariifolium TaxID=118510 RepID=A0A6L2KJ27_TANCI|nr:reverse transcriptase domain-containing protein [Tanacetum cinerariifolium]
MPDNRTIEEQLQAPMEGYGEAIVIPEINAVHFEIKLNLLQLGEMKAITTRSSVAYKGPSIPTPTKVVEQETEETTDKEQMNFQGSTAYIQPPVVPIPEPNVPKTSPKPNILYPLRLNDQKLRKKLRIKWRSSFKSFKICTLTLVLRMLYF